MITSIASTQGSVVRNSIKKTKKILLKDLDNFKGIYKKDSIMEINFIEAL